MECMAPLSNKEKQANFRARRAMLDGAKEVRGIYLPEALHKPLKELAAKMAEKAAKEAQSK